MIKTRNPTSLVISCILLFLLLFIDLSCNQTNEKDNYNGTWVLKEQNYTEKIILQHGKYIKEYSSDDLRVNTSGKFYFNRNENRLGITISLIPNKVISESDTIFQECEYLDIIKINDSNLVIQKPNQWIRNANDKFISVNEILIYKKQ
jgi:hypothetical protein